MLLLPSPGRRDYFFERGVGGFPAERALELFLAGDEDGRIAGAPRPELARDLAAGNALRRIDHFEDGKAPAIANVEGLTGNAFDFFERADVGIGDVQDVDIVTDASTVGCGIVRTKDIDKRQIAAGSIENPRDQVGFDAVGFPAVV